MGLVTSFVPLHKIKPTASRWNFSDTALETAARLALQVEGIINPIVIRREQSSNSYIVLDGNFEYYAMAYAHQMDAQRCVSVEAFIVEPKDEPWIQKQLVLFRGHFASSAQRYSELQTPSAASQRMEPSIPASLLEIFNGSDPTTLLNWIRRIGLTGKNAEKIVESIQQERQQHSFISLKDVVLRIKGLTYEKMLALVEVRE